MNSVCVSVIIPCYNAGKWIDKAVGSIKAQDFTDYELIVVDDGSDDLLTKEKIAAYQQDPTIRILVNEQNKGVLVTRNRAIRVARGKYVATLDADDYYDSTFLGKAVSVMEKKDKVGIVYSYTQLFGDRDSKYKNGASTLIKELSVNRIHASCMFRKECLDQCGGYDEEARPEDWDLAICILALGWKAYCIKEFLLFYQVRKDSQVSYVHKRADFYTNLLYKRHRELYDKYFWRIIFSSLGEYIRRPYIVQKKVPVFDLACKEHLPRWLYISLRWFRFRIWLSSYNLLMNTKRRLGIKGSLIRMLIPGLKKNHS